MDARAAGADLSMPPRASSAAPGPPPTASGCIRAVSTAIEPIPPPMLEEDVVGVTQTHCRTGTCSTRAHAAHHLQSITAAAAMLVPARYDVLEQLVQYGKCIT